MEEEWEMLYGRLTYCRPGKPKGFVNVGDYFQTFAIDYIYANMGIAHSEIINIDRHALESYVGEAVTLPLNAWFGYREDTCRFSKNIKPVFIGYHNLDKNVNIEMSQYGMIGCRDEATYQVLSRAGIHAYISGCMTVLFPKRDLTPQKEKIFLVDLPQSVMKIIPGEIKEKAELISHEIRIDENADDAHEQRRLEAKAREILIRYREEATLVITSRLHAALPCMAMGIPVILLREGVDERFTFLDKFIPIYNTKDKEVLTKIKWQGHTTDIEQFKKELISCACEAIKGTLSEQKAMGIHDCYMDRDRTEISIPFMVKAYENLHRQFPGLADFIREKILFRFTIASSREGK